MKCHGKISGRGISSAQLPHCRSNSGPRYPGSSVWGQVAYHDSRNCLVDDMLLSLRPDADLSDRIKGRKGSEELCLSLKCQALAPDLGVPWPPCYVVVLSRPAQATCSKTGIPGVLIPQEPGGGKEIRMGVFS